MSLKRINQRDCILVFVTAYFLFLLGFVTYISLNNLTDTPVAYFEQLALGILPLIGGIGTFIDSHRRKSFHNVLGVSIKSFSIGLITWGLGNLVWSAYNFFLGVNVPFPSWADVGYVLTPIFWMVGILLLPKVIGTKYQFRKSWGKIVSVLIPVVVFSFSFYLVFYKFYNGIFAANGENIGLILNFYYPLADSILLSFTLVIIILSWKSLGGALKKPILFILCSFIVMYVADMEFTYYSLNGIYRNGDWIDILFCLGLFLLSFGVNSITLSLPELKNTLYPVECEDIFAQLALKIIKEEEKLIGGKAWELALEVPGLIIDSDRVLKITKNKNETINELISQYEQIFGNASRELARDAIKNISTISNTIAIDIMVTLNINSVVFFIRHASTGNFYSIFPFNQNKFQIDRHHPIIYYLLNHKGLISNSAIPDLVDEAYTIAEASDLKEISQELTKYKSEITSGVYSDNELIGVLMIGEKAAAEKMTQKDISYITDLVKSSSEELGLIMHYRDTQGAILRKA